MRVAERETRLCKRRQHGHRHSNLLSGHFTHLQGKNWLLNGHPDNLNIRHSSWLVGQLFNSQGQFVSLDSQLLRIKKTVSKPDGQLWIVQGDLKRVRRQLWLLNNLLCTDVNTMPLIIIGRFDTKQLHLGNDELTLVTLNQDNNTWVKRCCQIDDKNHKINYVVLAFNIFGLLMFFMPILVTVAYFRQA